MKKYFILTALIVCATYVTSAQAFWSFIGPILGVPIDAGFHQAINSEVLSANTFEYPLKSGKRYSFWSASISKLNQTTSEVDDVDVHKYNEREHFDNNSLQSGFELLKRNRQRLLRVLRRPNPTADSTTESQFFLGLMLHQIQDFYSHTTYVEKMTKIQNATIINFGDLTRDPSALWPANYTTNLALEVCTALGNSLLNNDQPPLSSGYYDVDVPSHQCRHGNFKYAATVGCPAALAKYNGTPVFFIPDGINKDHPCFTDRVGVAAHKSAKDFAKQETLSFVTSIVSELADTQNGPGFCALLGINPALPVCAAANVNQASQQLLVGVPITAFDPITFGWGFTKDLDYTCATDRKLPVGLSLKTIPPTATSLGACRVSGTPTEAVDLQTYKFTVSDYLGRDSGKVSNVKIVVSVNISNFPTTYRGNFSLTVTQVIPSAETSQIFRGKVITGTFSGTINPATRRIVTGNISSDTLVGYEYLPRDATTSFNADVLSCVYRPGSDQRIGTDLGCLEAYIVLFDSRSSGIPVANSALPWGVLNGGRFHCSGARARWNSGSLTWDGFMPDDGFGWPSQLIVARSDVLQWQAQGSCDVTLQ